jgi:hypothetical protein
LKSRFSIVPGSWRLGFQAQGFDGCQALGHVALTPERQVDHRLLVTGDARQGFLHGLILGGRLRVVQNGLDRVR